MATLDLVSAPLSPLRRAVLEALSEAPASATEVAGALGESRQRVNYHVRALEREGLVELVEERARRGCTERVVRASCHAVVVEPAVVGTMPEDQDRFAADALLSGAARMVRDVAAARHRGRTSAGSACSPSRWRPRSASPARRTWSASPTRWASASPSSRPSSARENASTEC